jgi:methylmalonyl-CoA mutase cobalamin-binding domain/chain
MAKIPSMEKNTRVQQILPEIQRKIAEISSVEEVKGLVTEALDLKVNPIYIVEAMNRGLVGVGEKYEAGEFFLSELIMAGIIATEITGWLKPYLEKSTEKTLGKVVIGTVKGDLHDIGKNIVISMMSSAGFEVVDLGIDVPPEKFIEAARRERPDIVAMSCLLTSAMTEVKNVIGALKEAGLREKVKVLIGGRPVTPEFAEEVGADSSSRNAVEAVKIARVLVGR